MKVAENVIQIHNNKIYSDEECAAAKYLKEKNLKKTNEMSKLPRPRNTFYTRYGKRIIDLAISVPIVIILIPVYIFVSLGVFLDVGRPILYKQTRVGRNGEKFDIYKFRSMNDKKDEKGNLLPPNQRVTKFGRFIRKYSLDELAGFWNILKGDMSVIGPRPLVVFFVDSMSERHKMRHAVRPGLECPRVIKPDYEDSCTYQWTFENDIWYVEHVGFWQDVKMFFLLVKMVFSFKRRSAQAEVKGVSYFVGYDEEGHAMSMNKFREIAKEQDRYAV